tara:strand:- start:417 stop:698 length:282 start_codon:yes stop_codon:yes gene_type:complete
MCYKDMKQGAAEGPDEIFGRGSAFSGTTMRDYINMLPNEDQPKYAAAMAKKKAIQSSSSKQTPAKKGAVQKPKYSNVKPMEKKGGSERRSLFS